MVRTPPTEGNHYVAPYRNRPAYRRLVRRRTVLRDDRRQRCRSRHADRLIGPLKGFLMRSFVIGFVAFSTTILLIANHAGTALA